MKLIGCGIVTWQLLMIFPPTIINEIASAIQRYFQEPILKRMMLFMCFNTCGIVLIGSLHLVLLLFKKVRATRKDNHQTTVTTYPLIKRVTLGFDYCLLMIYVTNIAIGFLLPFEFMIQSIIVLNVLITDQLLAELIQFIVLSLLCYYVFHTKLFRHHFFSFGLLLVGFLALLFYIPLFQEKSVTGSLVNLALLIPNSMKIMWEKTLMQNKSILPSLILFLQGIGAVFGSIAMIEIAQVTKCSERWLRWGYKCAFNEPIEVWASFKVVLEAMNLLFFVLYAICSGLYALSYLLINYYLSPPYLSIAKFIVQVISLLIVIYSSSSEVEYLGAKILLNLCFILTALGSLIYNEMVILYFCGLERNTKKGIMDRGDEDDLDIIINMKEIIKLREEGEESKLL